MFVKQSLFKLQADSRSYEAYQNIKDPQLQNWIRISCATNGADPLKP